MAGSKTKKNTATLLTNVPADTDANLRAMTKPIPPGVPVYNTTTQEFKIGCGQTFDLTPPHRHPNQYSGVGHEHMGGFDEKWYRTMPRLIQRKALSIYPELIPLEGQIVTGDIALSLEEVYSESVRINPVITDGDMTIVQVTASSVDENLYAWNIFNKPIDVENVHWVTDQWITDAGTTTCTLTIEFKGLDTYILDGYDIISRLGHVSAPFMDAPSPKQWTLEGSLDGITWYEIETITDEPKWQTGEDRSYDTPTPTEVKHIKFTFSQWYMTEDATLTPGLKRLYLYGRNKNSLMMPNIEAPKGFVYVVPFKDLGIGMKHEEIGDIIYMTRDTKVTPINRVPVDGRLLNVYIEPDLYGLIQYEYDKIDDLTGVVVTTPDPHSIANVNNTISWNSDQTDNAAVAEYFEVTGLNNIISAYTIYPKPDGVRPIHWLVEGYDGTQWHTLHDKTFDINTETYGKFKLAVVSDSVIMSKYRFTIVDWTGTGTIGLKDVQLFTHLRNQYYIPTIPFNISDQLIPYIVTRVRTEDVTANIVLRLQNAVATLTNTLTDMQSRITALEIPVAQNP